MATPTTTPPLAVAAPDPALPLLHAALEHALADARLATTGTDHGDLASPHHAAYAFDRAAAVLRAAALATAHAHVAARGGGSAPPPPLPLAHALRAAALSREYGEGAQRWPGERRPAPLPAGAPVEPFVEQHALLALAAAESAAARHATALLAVPPAAAPGELAPAQQRGGGGSGGGFVTLPPPGALAPLDVVCRLGASTHRGAFLLTPVTRPAMAPPPQHPGAPPVAPTAAATPQPWLHIPAEAWRQDGARLAGLPTKLAMLALLAAAGDRLATVLCPPRWATGDDDGVAASAVRSHPGHRPAVLLRELSAYEAVMERVADVIKPPAARGLAVPPPPRAAATAGGPAQPPDGGAAAMAAAPADTDAARGTRQLAAGDTEEPLDAGVAAGGGDDAGSDAGSDAAAVEEEAGLGRDGAQRDEGDGGEDEEDGNGDGEGGKEGDGSAPHGERSPRVGGDGGGGSSSGAAVALKAGARPGGSGEATDDATTAASSRPPTGSGGVMLRRAWRGLGKTGTALLGRAVNAAAAAAAASPWGVGDDGSDGTGGGGGLSQQLPSLALALPVPVASGDLRVLAALVARLGVTAHVLRAWMVDAAVGAAAYVARERAARAAWDAAAAAACVVDGGVAPAPAPLEWDAAARLNGMAPSGGGGWRFAEQAGGLWATTPGVPAAAQRIVAFHAGVLAPLLLGDAQALLLRYAHKQSDALRRAAGGESIAAGLLHSVGW